MSVQDVWQLCFDFFSPKPVSVEPVEEEISSDGGLLIFRQWDECQGFTAGFAEQLEETRRDPEHSLLEMVRSRVFGILAGYEDQNDHDALRSDGLFKLLVDRLPEDDDLASQPTLSRFENSITAGALLRLETWFLERFVESFEEPPQEVTLDVDVFDDPTHGVQQLTLFHGFYRQYQYQVRALTCAENDRVVWPALLYGTADPALGLERDLPRIVAALRARFPDVVIRLRADSGYAKPWLYRLCERLGVEYSIGLGMNNVLKQNSDELLQQAVERYEATGIPQRLFTGFDYQAGSWGQPRWVVVKCEAGPQGTNRRAVVTNRPGARAVPRGAYDAYAERGESENRNKELKCELCADRLSDHRYLANCFRMFLHCLAHNVLVSLRQAIADPPAEETPDRSLDSDAVPPEAKSGRERRRGFNRRREADPLGEGHAGTWRMRLIKVAVRIKTTARRVRVFLSASWPFLDHFHDVGRAVLSGP
ncbi:MAG: IS1380 family transposase [Planctomycetota bacterium]|nr:MAG: IS1380 family transposase [Planctomycetota bacterium]